MSKNNIDFLEIRKNVKYLLFDLDGSLVNDKRVMDKKNFELPTLLKQLNLEYSIITGRPEYMMLKEINILKPTLPVVSVNGAIIIDTNNKILYERSFNQDVANQLLADLLNYNLDFYLYTPTQIYVNPLHFEHVDKWRSVISQIQPEFQWKISDFKIFQKNRNEPILKFLVCTNNYEIVENLVKSKYSNDLAIARSTPNTIDVNSIDVNKGLGLLKLAETLGADLNQFMVFGDGGNDIPMFKLAKYSVAMKNAADFVKEAALMVTDLDNNHGGIYEFIKKIWTN